MKSHTDARAIAAVFHGFRTIASHKEVTLEFRLPMEKSSEALAMLGSPGPDNWVAIAKLNLASTETQATVDAGEEAAGTSSVPAEHGPEGVEATGSAAHSLDAKPPRAQRRWEEIPIAEQAGILSADPVFSAFLIERHCDVKGNSAADVVRKICGVRSRADIQGNHMARMLWHQLVKEYRQWEFEARVVP